MLERPDIQDEQIRACLLERYEVYAGDLAFLPLGADPNTAVYRAVADDTTVYFVKLRQGIFDETSVALPKLLSDQGITQIIPPLVTKTGQLWANLGAFTVILYPFIEGCDGYAIALSDHQWRDFGIALSRIHTAVVPPTITRLIRQETFAAHGRERVKMLLVQVADTTFDDPIAIRLAAFLHAKRDAILDLVGRAERRAQVLQARAPEYIVCHSDVHAGNILIGANDQLYIVDWDDPILAPKERDLMFIGGGQGFVGRTAQEEEALFYQGYGQAQIDPIALAYYRYERIVQDIAVDCEQILLRPEGGENREQSLRFLMSNFLSDGTIDIAYRSDMTRLAGE